MKRVVMIFAFLVATLPSLIAQPAQQQQRMNGNAQQQAPQRKSMSDEEFLKFQIDMMVKQLNLNEDKVESFTNLYTEFSKKMSELQPKPKPKQPQQSQGGEQGAKRVRPSAEEVEAQILESFDVTERSNALKREYYFKFKEILTPQRILKMYNLERRFRERMLSESERRAGGGSPQGGGRSPQPNAQQ